MVKKTEKPAGKIGRPSLYSETLGEEIVDRVAAGEDIAGICKTLGISLSVLHRWREVHPAFMEAYARARQRSGEASESRIQAIMDDARAGKIDANTARVLIDGEKWLASKRAPRTHGDRVEVEHSGQGDQGVRVVLSFGPAPQPQAIDAEVVKPAEEEKARERQLAAQNNDAGQAVRENLPEQVSDGRARDLAAAQVGLSGKTVDAAARAIEDGIPAVEAELEKYGTWEGFLASACGGQVQIVNATSI